jgi:hypothetical protein
MKGRRLIVRRQQFDIVTTLALIFLYMLRLKNREMKPVETFAAMRMR